MKKKILLLLLATIALLPVRAQIGEPRTAIAIGVNGGVSMNTIGFDPTIKQKLLIGPTLGATLRITSEKYFKTLCALQLEVNYSQLGWNEDIMNNQSVALPDTYQRKMDYIQLPMLARLAWGYEKKGAMFYFLAGPQIGFCFNEKSERSDIWTTTPGGTPDRPNNMFAQYDMPIDHKFDYGITAGLGVELNTKIGHFMIDGRYYYGLSDIYKNGKKDVFSRSNHGTIIAKFTYLIDLRK